MKSFSQKASIILMTIVFMVAILRITSFSTLEEDEIEELLENVADVDDEENAYLLHWSFSALEIKLESFKRIEFQTAVKNRLKYLNPLLDKILMPPEKLV